ncbi:MAG: TIGR02186 family protein [Alphaproteobacteria bacterium]|nr:TIGR02186 family protein [Alphaproteobacteria bacterium]
MIIRFVPNTDQFWGAHNMVGARDLPTEENGLEQKSGFAKRRVRMLYWPFMAVLCLGFAAFSQISVARAAESGKSGVLAFDLSSHEIRVDSGYEGAEITLFGTAERTGNVVVVVRGPAGETKVHRKDKILGLWINHKTVEFKESPQFYAVAATGKLSEIAESKILMSEQIGTEHVQPILADAQVTEAEKQEFTEALIADNIRHARFQAEVTPIAFISDRLFRTILHFPNHLPMGEFTVTVYLFHNGAIAAKQTQNLTVKPVGMTAFVSNLAENYPFSYGVLAVILALIVGTIIPLLIDRKPKKAK